MTLDPLKVKEDFPILRRQIRGKPLVFLDSGASSQKPRAVIDAISSFYETNYANVHRGVYLLSQEASELYENVRDKVCEYLGRPKTEEVIFTSGATDAVNLVATALERRDLGQFGDIGPGDDIVVTRMEHHANFVPWQQLALKKKANFKIVELTPEGRIDMEDFKKKLSGRPKIVAFTMMSNVLGTVNPVREMATLAKKAGALVFIDGAQGVVHLDFKISDLGPIDFLAFSAHKMCGPTGVGVLWARSEVLWAMQPYRYGGDMIAKVDDGTCTWNELPWKFEAGTPHIEGVIGFGAALDYLLALGRGNIAAHEKILTAYALKRLGAIEGLRIIGPATAESRGAVISFLVDGVHPHDLATFLDMEGIATRAGHHCAQPLMRAYGEAATIRASFYIYNTTDDVDRLAEAIIKAQDYFRVRRTAPASKNKTETSTKAVTHGH